MRFTLIADTTEQMAEILADRANRAENALAERVRKDTSPYVPMSGSPGGLDSRTRVVGNTIIYPGPYARYLYFGKKMVEIGTGRGAMRIVDDVGNEYIRFHKGAKLRPTDIPLKYNKTFHPKAGSHWFDRSKADNLEKWRRIASKEISNGK